MSLLGFMAGCPFPFPYGSPFRRGRSLQRALHAVIGRMRRQLCDGRRAQPPPPLLPPPHPHPDPHRTGGGGRGPKRSQGTQGFSERHAACGGSGGQVPHFGPGKTRRWPSLPPPQPQPHPTQSSPAQSVSDSVPPGRQRRLSLFWTPSRRRASEAQWLSQLPEAGGSLRP